LKSFGKSIKLKPCFQKHFFRSKSYCGGKGLNEFSIFALQAGKNMNYNFNEIEAKWQKYWSENQTFKASNHSDKPKFYCLDMFPYPSGAGLHVGHPLGYIASDIVSRFKRHRGFNVLHPMGYDSFGLPAEQYAIQTGQHPAITTKENIARYRQQMDKIGFSFDWSREVRTSDPNYYRWTQWIFIQLFESWYDNAENKARDIKELVSIFSSEGNAGINAACDEDVEVFSAKEWKVFSEKRQQEILLKYRLTYLAETKVNWCPALGTVLANDEIVNGVSERGGHPVERKKMKQWSMRISAYAERLLQGLEKIDWSESLKETQRNWIGKSVGAKVEFRVQSHPRPFPKGREPYPDGHGESNKGSSSLGKGFGEDGIRGYMTANPKISTTLLNHAKEMRANPTPAEAVLWEKLKGKKLGVKFRRQHPIDNYIVDFVCLSKKIIIEVDGEIHQFQKEADEQRALKLAEKLGYVILRFSNEEVLKNIDSVIDEIKNSLSHPEPFPKEKDPNLTTPEESRHGSLSFGEGWGEDEFRISVFTTRPDTIFGVTFMTLAPEHELVSKITTPEQKEEVEAYIKQTAKRSERDRMADVKNISGVFTGAYAEHPFTGEAIPIWIGDYVLAGYGTGAVMAVPSGDQRDYDFAKHFDIPIKNIFEGIDISQEAYADKEADTKFINSDFLNGLTHKEALKKIIAELEKTGQGKGKTNYRLRDAVFSRQRYWGEPFPVYYKDGIPQMIAEEHLPLKLPEVEKYLPTETGEPPLGRADVWAWDEEKCSVVSNQLADGKSVFPLELNTMPGWAGSSWYFFRYMEPASPNGGKEKRDKVFASEEAMDYWKNVDLYIGGSEHGTGHLLYARFWVKFLKDRDLVPVDEPFQKLINQGMILGESAFVYRVEFSIESALFPEDYNNEFYDFEKKLESKIPFLFISNSIAKNKGFDFEECINKIFGKKYLKIWMKGVEEILGINEDRVSLKFQYINQIHVDVSLVNSSNELDIEAFKNWRPEFKNAEFIPETDGTFKVSREPEKMSKSKYNVVNPDDICEEYGADTLRMYEMFLGPLEQAKPWNTAGISGVHNFLKKLWKLYHSGENGSFYVTDSPSSGGGRGEDESLKILHKTIKKATEDIGDFSFNTSVSSFMICVNELTAQKCNSREVLEPLAVLVSPYAPHIAEELWEKLGHSESISTAEWPRFEEKYLVESTKTYPISFNGKMRFTLDMPANLSKEEIEKTVLEHERTQKQLDGKNPKKVIVVPGKIVNIVV
jgi:leucyl-tRNA synthetase